MAVRFAEGKKKFEGKPLTGPDLLEELLAWDRVASAVITKPTEALLATLPQAFQDRYGFLYAKSKSLKKERLHAAKHLVEALTDQRRHVRKMAIDCLEAMFGRRRGYDPDAPQAERKRKQREWRRALPR